MSMNLIPGIESTGSALSAEKIRLEIIAQNIANSNTTQDASGNVYTNAKRLPLKSLSRLLSEESLALWMKICIREFESLMCYDDQTPGRMIFNPGHPHANEDGMVEMPNVDVSREMIDLISASRAYEANLTVVKTSRRLAQQALAIGR